MTIYTLTESGWTLIYPREPVKWFLAVSRRRMEAIAHYWQVNWLTANEITLVYALWATRALRV